MRNGIDIADCLKISVLLRAVNTVARAVRIHALDKIPLVRKKQRQCIACSFVPFTAKSFKLAVADKTRDFDKALQCGTVCDRQSRQVCFAESFCLFVERTAVARRKQICRCARKEKSVLRTCTLYKLHGSAHERDIPARSLCVAFKHQQLAFKQNPARCRFVKPVIKLVRSVSLTVNYPLGEHTVAERSVGSADIKARLFVRHSVVGADAVPVSDSVPEQVERILKCSAMTLRKNRYCAVYEAVAVLHPEAAAPNKTLLKGVPLGIIKHLQIRQTRICVKHRQAVFYKL